VKHLVRVTVATHGLVTNQTGTVTATDTHSFWVADPHPAAGPNLPNGHWTEAGDLHPGDLPRTPAGTLLPILTLTTWTQPDAVHNLTIDTNHTYDVLAGNTPVLVHNSGCGPVGRRGAFRQAKRDAGVSNSQQPTRVARVGLTERNGRAVLDENGKPVMTREYTYTRSDGSEIVIREHSVGHSFNEGGVGDQGPHFNVRPSDNTRTGHVPGTQEHYPF